MLFNRTMASTTSINDHLLINNLLLNPSYPVEVISRSRMAVNTRNTIGVVLLLVVMVAAVSTPVATAEEFCWDKCIKRCKGELEVCSPKCIHFCNYQSGAVGYVKWAADKLKEADRKSTRLNSSHRL